MEKHAEPTPAQQRHYLEADQIALHVICKHANEREKALYSRAMETLGLRASAAEEALWISMMKSRRTLAWADAGLALLRPSSVLRRRMLLMVAILEASPSHVDQFLPMQCPPHKTLPVAIAALRGAFRGAMGSVLVKFSGV